MFELTPVESDFTPYHNGKGWRRTEADKPHDFILWDGEGITHDPNKPQNYVLFGCFDGHDHFLVKNRKLLADECLDLILSVSKSHPKAWHVSFAFGYDVTMILKSLPKGRLTRIKKFNHCRYKDYYLEYLPHKWFRVSKDGISATIYDTWGFFQSTLVAALKSYIPDHPLMQRLSEIELGKSLRGSFTWEDIDYVEQYWRIENELGHALVSQLKGYLYAVHLYITKWHGPGALADYVYRREEIHNNKSDCGSAVYDAARFAYAGGRFELFRVGRQLDVYSFDINSAYPEAISYLPSLAEGFWKYCEGNPEKVSTFAVYHIRTPKAKIQKRPSPLFHRNKTGDITFQQMTEGWYWAPEIQAMLDTGVEVEFIEGWEYIGWHSQPFAFVRGMYEERRAMKKAGIGSQIALKLCLNSLYGKMAQRAGWERSNKAPAWHQLEWAGWVTSYTRAKLFRLMQQIPWEHLIAVETDGLFSSYSPELLGITNSSELGGWEINHYDEVVYLQSGVYAKRQDNNWTAKYRGLDHDSISAQSIVEHSHHLLANEPWEPIVGTTTRFVGINNALWREEQHRGPMKLHMGKWEVDKKEITCGSEGKRKHMPKYCDACKLGVSAYDMPHDLMPITNLPLMSQRHDIPWLDGDAAGWRKLAELALETVTRS
jgi:hypothetical protein